LDDSSEAAPFGAAFLLVQGLVSFEKIDTNTCRFKNFWQSLQRHHTDDPSKLPKNNPLHFISNPFFFPFIIRAIAEI